MLNGEGYDDEEGSEESLNDNQDDLDMIVDLIAGDFAEKLGFQCKAFPISSKESTGWSEALFNCVRLSVLYEAEESEDEYMS